ncbi:MAG: hypothetical protein HUU19_07240 [Phycisphaerales bacterium]|nr:hypothetical protein [Phycisphaerales bacterium]
MRRIAPGSPFASANGTSPSSEVNAVMRIGASRSIEPSMIESPMDLRSRV